MVEMIHRNLYLQIVILLGVINQPMVSQAKFLLPQKSSFIGRLYKKITVQPKYCLSWCSCGSPNIIKEQPGIQLQPNEYPWLALIYDPNDLTTTYPATLINDKYVVSSAGNFYGKDPFQVKVKLGYHFNCQYEKTSITFSVSEIKIHPHYVHNSDNLDNDIALIKLSNAVHFNHEVSAICLPKKGVDYNGHVGYLASWNVAPKDAYTRTTTNCSPRKYKLPITSGSQCSDMVAMASESCIGVYGAKSILCEEDSGSGVFHRKDNHHELIGVLSHRQRCGSSLYNSPFIIKDQQMNSTSTSMTSMTAVMDLKMMNVTHRGDIPKGRQLHTLKQSDPITNGGGDHYYEPLPVFTRIDYHWDWIIENTKDSCYCKPRFQFSIKFNKFH